MEPETRSRRNGAGDSEPETRSRRNGAGDSESEKWSRRLGAGDSESESETRTTPSLARSLARSLTQLLLRHYVPPSLPPPSLPPPPLLLPPLSFLSPPNKARSHARARAGASFAPSHASCVMKEVPRREVIPGRHRAGASLAPSRASLRRISLTPKTRAGAALAHTNVVPNHALRSLFTAAYLYTHTHTHTHTHTTHNATRAPEALHRHLHTHTHARTHRQLYAGLSPLCCAGLLLVASASLCCAGPLLRRWRRRRLVATGLLVRPQQESRIPRPHP